MEKNPFIPDASAPHNISPGVAPELFIRLAKYLFSFLLKFTANILLSNWANVLKFVAEGSSYLPIEDIESPTERECSVCLEPLKNSNELIQLLCGHIFHKDCVYKWISEKNTCPNCRKSIIKR